MPDTTTFGSLGTQTPTQLPQPRKKPRGIPEQVSEAIGAPFEWAGKQITEPLLGELAGGITRQIAPQYAPQVEAGAREVGRGLPRMAAEALLTSRAGRLPRAIGFGDVALKSYAETPEDKPMAQRLAATGVQTAAWGMAPKFGGKVAGRVVPRPLDPRTIEPLVKVAARRGASTIGTVGAFETANAVSTGIQQERYNPFTPEHIGGLAAAVAPFEAMGLFSDLKAQKAARDTVNTRQESENAPRMAREGIGLDQPPQAPAIALRSPQASFDRRVGVGEGQEVITHSAFRPDPTKPEAEYGAHHPEILERLGILGFEARESRNTPQFGYRTNLRNFITREEASELMNRTGQKVDLEAPIQPHSDEIPSAMEPGKVISQQQPLSAKPLAADMDSARRVHAMSNEEFLKVAQGFNVGEKSNILLGMKASAADVVELKRYRDQFNKETHDMVAKITREKRKPTEEEAKTLGILPFKAQYFSEAVQAAGKEVGGEGRAFTSAEARVAKMEKFTQDELKAYEELGADPVMLEAELNRFRQLPKLPGESLTGYWTRVLREQGIDLSKTTEPTTLYQGVHDFVKWKFSELMGVDEAKASAMARFAADFAARIGYTQKETRVFASPPEVRAGAPGKVGVAETAFYNACC